MDLENGRPSNGMGTPIRARSSRDRLAVPSVRQRLTVGHALLLSSFLVCFFMLWQPGESQYQMLSLGFGRGGSKRPETVVVYVYSNTDPEYEANLVYFLEKGVQADDGCDYFIIIQEGSDVAETHELPEMPANVQFVRHPNECYDWGTFGWALQTGVFDPKKYKYFILLNSSVRGPFLPPYWPRNLHWSDALTSRLNDEVRMVGSTISCEGSWKGGVLTGEKRQNPHVQSYVVAMDAVALKLIQEDPTVLKCHRKYHDAVWYAEMGSSAAILRAGYNIDALMLRYQGVDWRQTENWGCNAALNPYAEHMYDGIDLSPFEVMFIKLKEFLLEANWTTATQGKKYSQWNLHQDVDIRHNEYNSKKQELRLMKILGMRHRGDACFDYDLYRQRNPDLPKLGKKDIWEHFVKHGQHEGRVFRFRCSPPEASQQSTALAVQAGSAAAAIAASTQGGAGDSTGQAALAGAAAQAALAAPAGLPQKSLGAAAAAAAQGSTPAIQATALQEGAGEVAAAQGAAAAGASSLAESSGGPRQQRQPRQGGGAAANGTAAITGGSTAAIPAAANVVGAASGGGVPVAARGAASGSQAQPGSTVAAQMQRL